MKNPEKVLLTNCFQNCVRRARNLHFSLNLLRVYNVGIPVFFIPGGYFSAIPYDPLNFSGSSVLTFESPPVAWFIFPVVPPPCLSEQRCDGKHLYLPSEIVFNF